MTILALDLGTKTGYAFEMGKTQDDLVSGVWDLKPKRFEGGGMRFLRFRRALDEIELTMGLSQVYFEEVRRHAGTDAAHVYGGLMGTLTAWCEEQEIPYSGVPVGTIKKHATGKGNANKAAMIAAVQDKGFWAVTDDNEADAIALLLYALDGEK